MALARQPARVALLVLALAAPAAAEVYVLTNGDRISGRTVTRGTQTFTLQTAYGRLRIPRAKIERIVGDDGKEEIITTGKPAAPPPDTTPVQLILVVTGATFWHAWDPPKGTDVDPTLRLEIRLDEQVAATFVDARLDPEEIRGAAVNTFGFVGDGVAGVAAPGVELHPPEARPGRIVLRIDLPIARAGARHLRLAYQVAEPSAAGPSFRDVADASLDVTLRAEAPTFVQVRQDRGRMEFSGLLRKRMKHVETFRLEAKSE
jgi:hypothetical protein